MAVLIKTTGEKIGVEPEDGKQFQLKELQTYVGGYIQLIRLSSGRMLVVDEDGRFKNYAHNEAASRLTAGQVFGDIVGDALIVPAHQMES